MFREHPDRYDLVITDMTMPGMTGDVLAEKLLALRSDLPIVRCTGHSARLTRERVQELGIRSVVMTPVVLCEIAAEIQTVLD